MCLGVPRPQRVGEETCWTSRCVNPVSENCRGTGRRAGVGTATASAFPPACCSNLLSSKSNWLATGPERLGLRGGVAGLPESKAPMPREPCFTCSPPHPPVLTPGLPSWPPRPCCHARAQAVRIPPKRVQAGPARECPAGPQPRQRHAERCGRAKLACCSVCELRWWWYRWGQSQSAYTHLFARTQGHGTLLGAEVRRHARACGSTCAAASCATQ